MRGPLRREVVVDVDGYVSTTGPIGVIINEDWFVLKALLKLKGQSRFIANDLMAGEI